MKEIIIMVVLIVVLPFLIVNFVRPAEQSSIDRIELNTNDETIVRVKRTETEEIQEIELYEYVFGVVAAEMPASFEIEALKAQAIASKNYVLRRINPERDYDVDDTVRFQVFRDNDQLKEKWGANFDKHSARIRKAVEATRGEYLHYNGNMVNTLYFSTSNGYTENNINVFGSELTYLRGVESAWDEKSTEISRETTMTRTEFLRKLELTGERINITNVRRSETGRVNHITINGREFRGTEVRSSLGLRSTDFRIIVNGNDVNITTRGFGHGVGMSQHGANGKAKAGYDYRAILQHYYPGSEIRRL